MKRTWNFTKKWNVMFTTIVSSNLAKAIAKEYDMDFREVLTGFKNIGEQIRDCRTKRKWKINMFLVLKKVMDV